MALFSRTTTNKKGSIFSRTSSKTSERTTIDVSTIEQLKAEAQSRGLKIEEDKPSFFRRTIDVISRPLYASAGAAKALIKGENVLKEAFKGFTGKEKETYSDVLEAGGVQNKYVKGIVGFALDVVLDPLTYFGGTAIKYGAKGIGKALKPAGKLGAKLAPETAGHLVDAAKNLKDAFGTAFKFGHKTTGALADDIGRAINKMGIAKEEIAIKNLKLFGKRPSETQLREATEIMMNNRLVERGLKKGNIIKSANKEVNAMVQTMKKKGQEIAQKAGLKTKTPVSGLQPLAQEARKYKSADEFVEAQPKLFHGTDQTFDRFSLKNFSKATDEGDAGVGIYFTADRSYAKEFGENTKEVFVDLKNPYRYKTTPFFGGIGKENFAKSIGLKESATAREVTEKLVKDGYDGVVIDADFSDGLIKSYEVVAFDLKSIKTKSQLTDIYTQATKGVSKTADEWYFPWIDVTKVGKAGAVGALKVSQQGYLKQFKNLIKDENILKKPVEAYSRREFQVVRDKIVGSTMDDMVKTYGVSVKAFDKLDDVTKALYKPIKDKTFGKQIGYLKEADAKFIDNYLFPEFKTIDMLAKASRYDSFTNWFKTWVTAYFPAFHVRNYISGNIQNYSEIGVQALNPKNHNSALGILFGGVKSKPIRIGKYKGTTGELNKVMKENFRGASRYISDIGNYVEEVTSNKFRVKKISKARNIGNFVEMNQKAVALSGALRKGQTLKEAIKTAERAGFDYSKITNFESKIMKRLVPFYTFARKNAELQLRTLAKHPERIINQAKLTNALSVMFGSKVTEEDLKGLPEWALNGLGFKVSGSKFFTKFGLPLEEFIERVNKPMMSSLQSLNPIIKYPLESKMGFDFFREKKITDINKLAPATGELLVKAKEKGIMPDWLDNALNVKSYVSTYDGKTKYTMSPKALHQLRNIPTSRFQNTLERMFDGDIDKVSKWLAFLSGAKIYDIDLEQQKYFNERDLRRDIEDQFLEKGVGQQFESFYIKKD